jgi:hypothetical protein
MISAIAGTVETNLDFMASPSRATRSSASFPVGTIRVRGAPTFDRINGIEQVKGVNVR